MGKYHHGDYDVYLCQLENAKRAVKKLAADIETLLSLVAKADDVLKREILPALQGAWNIAHEKK